MIVKYLEDDIYVRSRYSQEGYQSAIFLAGTVDVNNEFDKSWRKEAIKILEKLGFDGIVYVPELKDPSKNVTIDHIYQWYHQSVEHSAAVAFWDDTSANNLRKSNISSIILGGLIAGRPYVITYGCPGGRDPQADYETYCYDQISGEEIYESLDKLMSNAVNLAEENKKLFT